LVMSRWAAGLRGAAVRLHLIAFAPTRHAPDNCWHAATDSMQKKNIQRMCILGSVINFTINYNQS
jgi:hypothetical protein